MLTGDRNKFEEIGDWNHAFEGYIPKSSFLPLISDHYEALSSFILTNLSTVIYLLISHPKEHPSAYEDKPKQTFYIFKSFISDIW